MERRWVEELSGMNVFFVWRDGDGPDGVRLTTPPCQGTIVRGITRDCVLTLARDLGIRVAEEPTTIDGVMAGARSGRLVEMFACGTAAVVVPVGRVADAGASAVFGDGQGGPRDGPAAQRVHRDPARDPAGHPRLAPHSPQRPCVRSRLDRPTAKELG
ncbi:aminotransferase class IV [Luedemannella flava]